jgi:hypothetical protein
MRYVIIVLVVIAAVCLVSSSAFAQGVDSSKVFKDAKDLFGKQKWPRALQKFNLALKAGLEENEALEAALYVGAIYAETDEDDLAKENLTKYVTVNPTAEIPEAFTEKMEHALKTVRMAFPVVSDIGVEKENFKPFREKLGITFSLAADKKTLENTSLSFQILAAARRDVVFEREIKPDTEKSKQRFEWDGRNDLGEFFKTGDYVISITATRKDAWKHSADLSVVIGGNLQTSKAVTLLKRTLRIQTLSGQHHVNYIVGKHVKEVGEKPIKGSTMGFWNYVYYIPLGAIRDGLDFPIKYVCSLPYAGHGMTFLIPMFGCYQTGQEIWGLKRSEYRDPMSGDLDKDAWDHDTKVVDQRSAAMVVLAPVWALAYAGMMSVVSWAGTDDGIEKGFYSYIESNAFQEGYKFEYFFPNYRSLDFSNTRIDQYALENLQAEVSEKNRSLQAEIDAAKAKIDEFNKNQMAPFMRTIEQKFNKELYDYAEMTVKKK